MKIAETLKTLFSRQAAKDLTEEDYGLRLAENSETFGRDPREDHKQVFTAEELVQKPYIPEFEDIKWPPLSWGI